MEYWNHGPSETLRLREPPGRFLPTRRRAAADCRRRQSRLPLGFAQSLALHFYRQNCVWKKAGRAANDFDIGP